MLIQTTTGKETFDTGTSQYYVFVCPTRRVKIDKEIHLGMAHNIPNANISRMNHTRYPAVQGSRVDMGSWTIATHDVPDGTILKVWGQKTMSGRAYGSNQGTRYIGAILIQMRTGAPLHRITCQQVGHPKSSLNSVTVEGRFDIISLKDAAKAGAQLPMTFIQQFMNPRNDQLFLLEVLDQATAARRQSVTEVVKGDHGESIEIEVARTKRALDLDD